MADKRLGGLFGTDKPTELDGQAVQRKGITPSQKQLLDRISDPAICDQYKKLRKHHRVPQDLDEASAWIWLGTVLAEKHPAPAKRGPKPDRGYRASVDKRVLRTILAVSAKRGVRPETVIAPAVKVFTEEGIFKPYENSDSHKKRLKRRLRGLRDQVPERNKERNKMLAAVLLGHDFGRK
jgi:hypothetical protein